MRTKLIFFIVVLLAVLAGWIIGKDASRERVSDPTATATGTPSVIIERVPATATTSAFALPNLDRPIKVTATLSQETKTKTIARIQELTDELRNNNDFYSSWLDLALQRNLIGDYVAAEEIWIYVTQNWANDPVAYSNLANLYLMEFHDNERAEIYLLRAIEKNTTQVIFYENAYSFYRFVKKDFTKARQILEEGIAKNPTNAVGLRQLLADLEST